MPIPVEKIIRVSDGDTVRVQLAQGEYSIRLLFVDTEESLRGYFQHKPVTNAGVIASQFTKDWCYRKADYFLDFDYLYPSPETALHFSRDRYNRVLAYLYRGDELLNLQLLEQGLSPYFCKYGFSQAFHDEFLSAQYRSRQELIGIWNPETNKGGASRNYEHLLPWWYTRADQLEQARAFNTVYPAGCDNQCRLIMPQTRITALVDTQELEDRTTITRRGDRIRIGRPGQPFAIWIPRRYHYQEVLELIGAIAKDKQYIFFSGLISYHRGYPQIEIREPGQVSRYPQ
ncbi:MAG TPA: thermonuclease family protein [Cyanophyceae cyanobacterium]